MEGFTTQMIKMYYRTSIIKYTSCILTEIHTYQNTKNHVTRLSLNTHFHTCLLTWFSFPNWQDDSDKKDLQITIAQTQITVHVYNRKIHKVVEEQIMFLV